jgi:hypothetical protein
MTIIVPSYFNHIMAVLGLLLVWKLHALQVRVGRIQAVDFWARSGIRMFIHITPTDTKSCPACVEASGMVFHPSAVGKKNFKPLSKPCTSPSACRCLLVGLYGGWPDAQGLLARLGKSKMLQISGEDLTRLLGGPWERYPGASGDRIPVHLLEAMQMEASDPEGAIFRYRFIQENAKRERDFPFVVHSFIRQTDLLETAGRRREALAVVDQFLKVYQSKKKTLNLASDNSYNAMSKRKASLLAALR